MRVLIGLALNRYSRKEYLNFKDRSKGGRKPLDSILMFKGTSGKTYQDQDEYNLILSKAILCTGGAGSPSCADQRSSEPKVFRFERLAAAAVRWRRCSRLGQGFQPNRWRKSLTCITANRQSRHMGGFQRCPKVLILQKYYNLSEEETEFL